MYGLVQRSLEEHGLNLDKVKYVVCDYEVNLREPLQTILSGSIQVVGCFFHFWYANCMLIIKLVQIVKAFNFSQCLWRWIQTNGLSQTYNAGTDFYDWAKKLSTFPFVPSGAIQEARQIMEDDIDKMEDEDDKVAAKRTWSYFIPTWFQGKPFNKSDWHHEEQLKEVSLICYLVEEDPDFLSNKLIPTSNCGAEGVNSAENNSFGKHPSTRKFGKKLRMAIDEAENKARLMKKGVTNDQSSKYKKNQAKRIQEQSLLVEGIITTEELMENLSHTVKTGVAMKKKRKVQEKKKSVPKENVNQNDDVNVDTVDSEEPKSNPPAALNNPIRGRGRGGRARGQGRGTAQPRGRPSGRNVTGGVAQSGRGRGRARGRRGRGGSSRSVQPESAIDSSNQFINTAPDSHLTLNPEPPSFDNVRDELMARHVRSPSPPPFPTIQGSPIDYNFDLPPPPSPTELPPEDFNWPSPPPPIAPTNVGSVLREINEIEDSWSGVTPTFWSIGEQ